MMRLLVAIALAGCSGSRSSPDLGAPQNGADGSAVYGECTTLCYRPGDCQVAYPDVDVCPPGFLCALHFTCVADGGHD